MPVLGLYRLPSRGRGGGVIMWRRNRLSWSKPANGLRINHLQLWLSGSKSSRTVGQRKKSPCLMSSAERHAFPPHHWESSIVTRYYIKSLLYLRLNRKTQAQLLAVTLRPLYIYICFFFSGNFSVQFLTWQSACKEGRVEVTVQWNFRPLVAASWTMAAQ